MSKITPSELIASATGRVHGQNTNTSLRKLYGKEHTYTYLHKPEQWSEAQVNTRTTFGAAAYYARLIRKTPEAEAYFADQLKKQKKYHRIDNLMAHYVTEAMKINESLRTTIFAAYNEHQSLLGKTALHDAAILRQTAEAQSLWHSVLHPSLL